MLAHSWDTVAQVLPENMSLLHLPAEQKLFVQGFVAGLHGRLAQYNC